MSITFLVVLSLFLQLFNPQQLNHKIHIDEFVLPTPSVALHHIIVGPDKNLWFTEENIGRLGRITLSGEVTEYNLPILPLAGPYDVAAGADGNLWFTANPDIVGRMTLQGQVTLFRTPSKHEPVWITAGPDGNVWFSELQENTLGKVTPDGTISEYTIPHDHLVLQNWAIQGIIAGPDGNVWFTEPQDNQVGYVTPGGTFKKFRLPEAPPLFHGPFTSYPTWITRGPDNNLWFYESNNHRVGHITLAGRINELVIPPSVRIGELTMGPDHNLWSATDPDQITRISLTGSFTAYQASPGCYPHGIVTGPDGKLWFTEANTNRIGRLSL